MKTKLINKTFNELTIKEFIERPDTDKYKSWNTGCWVRCECSCGESVEAPLYGVQRGLIKSCGHLRSQQARETLRKNREANPTPTAIYITHNDKTMNLSEWSKETGIPRSTIMYRYSKGLTPDKILERRDDNEQNKQDERRNKPELLGSVG